jgi:asparagine synthase (glutamine-hydrolysing)
MQYIDIHTWLIGDILAKADKMTMAHSLELRVPFLDMEVARISKALPDELKWKNGMTKYVLRKAFQGDIPDTTNRRKKLGFPVPLATWLRDPQSPLYAHIRHNTFLEQYIDQQAIDRLIAEHTQGHRDHARKLYLLIMLSLWYTVCVQENHGN